MSSRERNQYDPRNLCAHLHPDDGIDPREMARRDTEYDTKSDRKVWQLCKQVGRTLQLALGTLPRADMLVEVSVQTVTPAPNAGRLRVVLAIPDPQRREEVAALLTEHGGRLRREVASTISRRRAPELAFEVIVEGGDRG
jgi:ribosome-binding factor A